MQAHQHGVPMLASSGYVAEVDRNKCKGCAKCSKFCQFGAINVVDGLKTIDYAKCMGCGACLTKCSNGAISLVRDQRKGEPLEIHKLMEEVLIQA
jgi:ferredoxin